MIPEFPHDIMDLARECLSTLLTAGIDVHPSDQPKAIGIIATSLLVERERLQADVIAAVADENDDCRDRVFKALRRAVSQ